jgi:hypothetical protein
MRVSAQLRVVDTVRRSAADAPVNLLRGRVWHISVPSGAYAICTDLRDHVVASHLPIAWTIGKHLVEVEREVRRQRGVLVWAFYW